MVGSRHDETCQVCDKVIVRFGNEEVLKDLFAVLGRIRELVETHAISL